MNHSIAKRFGLAIFNGVLSWRYGLTHVLSDGWIRWKLRRRKPLLIYQMGKVGSSSVLQTLRSGAKSYASFHVHVMSPDGIRELQQYYYGHLPRPLDNPVWAFTRHLFTGEFFAGYYQARDEKAKIITLVREPVGRTISMYFQLYAHRKAAMDRLSIPELLEDFWQQSEAGPRHHWLWHYCHHWFDNELKTVFDIDVYAVPFDPQKGYAIYESPKAEVLLVRLEDLDRVYREAFREFLGIDIPELLLSNQASEKDIKPRYRAFKEQITFTEDFLDGIYQSRLARHFYTEEERRTLRRRWLRQ